MSRIYIFTGKGGVGKTSMAAAHGKKSELLGKRTLLVSTDMAHNLGDIFEVNCRREVVSLSDKLDILELDPEYIMENEYKELINALTKTLFTGMDKTMEDFGMMPGMDELFSLMKIMDIYEAGKYENIIVDCAPTGETLSLLKFPELLSWYMEKIFPIGKVAVRMMAPISKTLLKVELPNKNAMNDIEKLYLRLYDLQQLLKDSAVTSIRLVTIPEKMVVEETKRNYMYMNLYNFHVDTIYVNRILPEDLDNKFFTQWKEIQNIYIKDIEESFMQLELKKILWFQEEIKGESAIELIAKDYLPDNIFGVKESKYKETFESTDSGYVLSVYLPNAKKEKLDVYKVENTLVIKIDNFKRNIMLPDVLRQYEVSKAKFEEDVLRLYFDKEN